MLNGKETDIKVGGDYDPIPSDKYTVQVVDVNLVTQFNKWKGEDQELLNYQFAILDDKPMPDSEETTRSRLLWHRMSQALSSKSWLLKMVKAVYGRDLTKEELEAFASDPESIIGKQVDVMVEQNPSNDGSVIYNNIISYSKCVKQLDPYMDTPAATTKTKKSSPAIEKVETPSLTPEGGMDFEDAFPAAKPEKSNTGDVDLDKILDSDVDTDEVIELEAKLKAARAKKTRPLAEADKKAKKAKK